MKQGKTKVKELFDPEANLMTALSKLTEDTARQWYKEYLEYHNGVDQGIRYMIGYFEPKEFRDNLTKWMFS